MSEAAGKQKVIIVLVLAYSLISSKARPAHIERELLGEVHEMREGRGSRFFFPLRMPRAFAKALQPIVDSTPGLLKGRWIR